jgi:hypothetical protein
VNLQQHSTVTNLQSDRSQRLHGREHFLQQPMLQWQLPLENSGVQSRLFLGKCRPHH